MKIDWDFREEFRLATLACPDRARIKSFYLIKLFELGQFSKVYSILILLSYRVNGGLDEFMGDCQAAARNFELAAEMYKRTQKRTPILEKKFRLVQDLLKIESESI